METNIFLLTARKKEYLANFQRLSVGYFSSVIYDMYDQVKKSNKIKKLLLKEFQAALASISTWDDAKKEFKDHNAKLLDKLMNGIFKLDIVLRHELSNNAEKYIPCLNDFMYQCLLNIARLVWKNPVLVYDVGVDKITYQQNKLKLEKLVMGTVKDTFTYYLPFDIDDVVSKVEEETKHEPLEDIKHQIEEESDALESDEQPEVQEEIFITHDNEDEDVENKDNLSVHELDGYDGDGDDEGDDYSDIGTCTPDDMSVLDDISEEDDENEKLDVDYNEIDEIEDNDDEPLTKQLDIEQHVVIPRYEKMNNIVDIELNDEYAPVKEAEQAIKHIYIGEKPDVRDTHIQHKNVENDVEDVADEEKDVDIKIVNIDEKGSNGGMNLNLEDKVHKKNSLLAIKEKVKSQIFVEKREQRRFGGASFF